MSHNSTPTKKSVFDRIGRAMSTSSVSSMTSANVSSKSMHGFCNAFLKTGTCPLGDNCKYIHEQPNLDKSSDAKGEIRITKTITQTIDLSSSSSSIKSIITVSNDQRPSISSNLAQSSRIVVESGSASNDHSESRLSSSDRKQSSQSHHSDSKTKSSSTSNNESSKKKKSSSSHDSRRTSSGKTRGRDSESPVSSDSGSEHLSSSSKRKKQSDQTMSSKYKRHTSKSPNRDDDESFNDSSNRSGQKSPKRTIVLASSNEKRKDGSSRRTSRDEPKSKSKSEPDIEYLGKTKASQEKKSVKTIHQQAEFPKKSSDVKREKRSPMKSLAESQRHHSSSSLTNEKYSSSKTDDNKSTNIKTQSTFERSDRRTGTNSVSSGDMSSPIQPVVRLSPTPPISSTSESIETKIGESSSTNMETIKTTSVSINSPPCVVLDDDSSPSPTRERKLSRQTPTTPMKKTSESEKSSSKSSKRSRESDKTPQKEKNHDEIDSKRKRTSDDPSKKSSSSTKSTSENRSTSNRSETRRSDNVSSRDDSSSRKHKERSESKSSRTNESKDRTTISTTKSRHSNDRRDEVSSERRRSSSNRNGKSKTLDNITDSDDHLEDAVVLKPTPVEIYSTMDWTFLSRDKRIPSNSQVTSRVTRLKSNGQTLESLGIAQRLLTDEQKEKVLDRLCQTSPLTHSMRQLQQQSTGSILQTTQRRFGSCAKDMIEMRHKWFMRSVEPVQQYQFMNKEHYVAFQQAITSLLNQTSSETANLPIETTSTDVL